MTVNLTSGQRESMAQGLAVAAAAFDRHAQGYTRTWRSMFVEQAQAWRALALLVEGSGTGDVPADAEVNAAAVAVARGAAEVHGGHVSHLDVQALLDRANDNQHGFFTTADVALLAADERGRLTRVLVRCGGCRFVCAAQDVSFLESAICAKGDYVRDYSVPAGRAR